MCPKSILTVRDLIQLAESTRDVVFGFLARRFEEHLTRFAKLNQLAQIHIRRVIRATCRLLHVMSHDDNRVIFFEFGNQLFDFGCRDRV